MNKQQEENARKIYEAFMKDAKVVDLLPKKAKIKHPLPFPCYVPEGIGMTEVYNPISKRSIELNAEALVVYEVTIGLNRICLEVARNDPNFPLWDYVRKGIEWFQEYYPDEYFVLLD